MLLFVAILLGLPSFVGLMYLLVSRTKGKRAMTVDVENTMAGDGPTRVHRFKKGNHAPVQDNLYVIQESDEELIIDDTNSPLHLAEDSSDSDDEELVFNGSYKFLKMA